jgi:hypothetical protein
MKIAPLSPQGLRDRVRADMIAHASFYGSMFDVLRNALVLGINTHLRSVYSLAQAGHGADEELDIAECYALDVPIGLLRQDVIDGVLQEFVDAGWKHSTYMNGRILIARTEILIEKGRMPFFASPSFVSAFPDVLSGAQSSSLHPVVTPAA